MQVFTKEELQKYNGNDGMPSYIAFEGKVYDVSSSKRWANGVHFKKHFAGSDLTSAMASAPHAQEVFEHFTQVGELVRPINTDAKDEASLAKERYMEWYTKYHPHPALIHFPIALHYFSAFADVLFLRYPSAQYDTAVFLSFVIATLMGLVALVTGVFSWWINYDFAMSKPFVTKLIGAIFTLFVGFIPIVQKIENPMVAFSGGVDGFVYHFVIFITVLSVTIVGYYGGKITWGSKIS